MSDDASMDAETVIRQLCAVIDAHNWEALPSLLAPSFSCRLVHTGEVFDRDGWVRLNAEYPGFDRMYLEDLVATPERAVARCRVTGTAETGPQEFAVASFATVRDGQITELVEVWTDLDQSAPAQTRPSLG